MIRPGDSEWSGACGLGRPRASSQAAARGPVPRPGRCGAGWWVHAALHAASSASVAPGARASSSMCQRSKLARCWRATDRANHLRIRVGIGPRAGRYGDTGAGARREFAGRAGLRLRLLKASFYDPWRRAADLIASFYGRTILTVASKPCGCSDSRAAGSMQSTHRGQG